MKFLPIFRLGTLLVSAAALSACNSVTNTAANRRELYNVSYNQSGSWHDYTRRRQAEAETGFSGGTAPSALPGRKAPSSPVSGPPGPLPAGTETGPSMQAPLTPAAPAGVPNVPAPADVAPTSIPGTDTPAPVPTGDPAVPPT